MKRDKFDSSRSQEERVRDAAAEWLAKRDRGFASSEQDAFFEWLAEDPAHRKAYDKCLAFWEEMNVLEDWRPQHSEEPNPDLLAVDDRPSFGRSFAKVLAVAAVLTIGAILAPTWILDSGNDARMLAYGGAEGYENHLLDDGSVVELNVGAEASVQYSRNERLIFLHAGEVHFMVAKDNKRPFVVRAGDALVRATGTAFSVSMEDDGVEVMVTEGKVMVEASGLENPEEAVKPMTLSRELVAGELSVIPAIAKVETLLVETVTYEEIDRRLGWKSEVLDFTDTPLYEVADQLNRRNRTKINIPGSELRDLKITAKLRSDNLDGFVELLDVTMNVRAERDGLFQITLREGEGYSLR